jgi:hypothetical protein
MKPQPKRGRKIEVDGDSLNAAKRWSRASFEKQVAFWREKGASDREIVAAMTRSRVLISPVALKR